MARFCINVLHKFANIPALRWTRPISQSACRFQNESTEIEEGGDDLSSSRIEKPKRLDVDPETSVRYVSSNAYSESYGNDPVWKHYRRNFKGSIPPKTRKTCVRQGEISTGSPCPICRDEYLILDMKNTKLLEQFISPYTGQVLDYMKTGLCQKQHKKLLLEVARARNHGYLEAPVPFRKYDYGQYLETEPDKES